MKTRRVGTGIFGGVALLLLACQPALADTVRINNVSGTTVYRLYAWPTRLVPRAYSILGSPLQSQNTTSVKIDNSYGDCAFTFQYDQNDPAELRKRRPAGSRPFKKKTLKSFSVNLCGRKEDVFLR